METNETTFSYYYISSVDGSEYMYTHENEFVYYLIFYEKNRAAIQINKNKTKNGSVRVVVITNKKPQNWNVFYSL